MDFSGLAKVEIGRSVDRGGDLPYFIHGVERLSRLHGEDDLAVLGDADRSGAGNVGVMAETVLYFCGRCYHALV